MGTLIKKLWTDEDAFLVAFRDLWAYLVGGLYIAAELISSGVIDLGSAGWYGGRIAQGAVVMLAFQKLRAGKPSRSGITAEDAAVIKSRVGMPVDPPPPGNVVTESTP